jgi:hypothetical protein
MSPKTIYRTQDGGQQWTEVATTGTLPAKSHRSGLPTVGFVHTLFFASQSDGWIGVDRGGYWRTTDGGATWHYAWSSAFRIGSDRAPSVGMLGTGFGWAVEANPFFGTADHAPTALYVTTDKGNHWREVYPPPPAIRPSSSGTSASETSRAAASSAAVPVDGQIWWASCQHRNSDCGAPPYPSDGSLFTNYALMPNQTIIAGEQLSSKQGMFIVTDGPAAGIHLLPAGDGIPIITKWVAPRNVAFSTTAGKSGTFDAATGALSIG